MSDSAINAARATGLVTHSRSCLMSGTKTCVCDYAGRLTRLAAQFEVYAMDHCPKFTPPPCETVGTVPGTDAERGIMAFNGRTFRHAQDVEGE